MTPELVAALGRYLADRELTGTSITVRPIGDGHANLTSLASDGERSVIVRRPPPPPFPPGANDVLREARVIAAVGASAGSAAGAGASVPVPMILATAEAGEVFDVPFFVMSYIEGPVVTTSLPPHLPTPEARRAFAFDLVDQLAALHRLDWRKTGLRGRPEGANLRQRERLARLVADESGAAPAAFRDVDAWLVANAPPESGAALVHGDYRLGNVIVHPALPAVAAVLDWELAAVGDPLVDLGYLVASWATQEAPLTPIEELGSATAAPGFPTRAELAERYGVPLEQLRWYVVLAHWKLAVLYEYSRRRGDDAYYADPGLVARFLGAARVAASA